MFFEELGFFGVRQMIPWVILLQIHLLASLCDPFGSCYDKVPSVAGEAAWGGLGSPLAAIKVQRIQRGKEARIIRRTYVGLTYCRHGRDPGMLGC